MSVSVWQNPSAVSCCASSSVTIETVCFPACVRSKSCGLRRKHRILFSVQSVHTLVAHTERSPFHWTMPSPPRASFFFGKPVLLFSQHVCRCSALRRRRAPRSCSPTRLSSSPSSPSTCAPPPTWSLAAAAPPTGSRPWWRGATHWKGLNRGATSPPPRAPNSACARRAACTSSAAPTSQRCAAPWFDTPRYRTKSKISCSVLRDNSSFVSTPDVCD